VKRLFLLLIISVSLPSLGTQAQECQSWIDLKSGEHHLWFIDATVWTPREENIVYPGEWASFRIRVNTWGLYEHHVKNYSVQITFSYQKAERMDICVFGYPYPVENPFGSPGWDLSLVIQKEWRAPECDASNWSNYHWVEPCQLVMIGFFNVTVTVHDPTYAHESGWETIGRNGSLSVKMRWWPETITKTQIERQTIYTLNPIQETRFYDAGQEMGITKGIIVGIGIGFVLGVGWILYRTTKERE